MADGAADPTLYLVDGSGYIFRAYFAVRQTLSTAAGLLLTRGWRGLCYDSDAHLAVLRRKLAVAGRRGVATVGKLLTPGTVATDLRGRGVPHNLDLLKVDIDSFDCPLLRVLVPALSIMSAHFR